MTLHTTKRTQHQVNRNIQISFIQQHNSDALSNNILIFFFFGVITKLLIMHYINHTFNVILSSSRLWWSGKIINHPNGTDVYHGVPKDYVCGSVRPDIFLQVIINIWWWSNISLTVVHHEMGWWTMEIDNFDEILITKQLMVLMLPMLMMLMIGTRCWKEKRWTVRLGPGRLLIQVSSSLSSSITF